MEDPTRDDAAQDEAPGFRRLVFLLAGGAVALGIGWLALYVAYRYLGSAW